MANAHTALVKQVYRALAFRKDCYCWINNTGALKVRESFIRFGKAGSSDIIGFTSDGKFLSVEVKTGTGRLTPLQVDFKDKCTKFRARHFVIREGQILSLLEYLDVLNLPKAHAS